MLNEAPGRIAIRFHARDVNLVMGPRRARCCRCRFACSSMDSRRAPRTVPALDEQGNSTLSEQRLYQLIRQPKPIADRLFEIEFLESGVEAYCFTFG